MFLLNSTGSNLLILDSQIATVFTLTSIFFFFLHLLVVLILKISWYSYWWYSNALGKYGKHLSYTTKQKTLYTWLSSSTSDTVKKWVNASIQLVFSLNGLWTEKDFQFHLFGILSGFHKGLKTLLLLKSNNYRLLPKLKCITTGLWTYVWAYIMHYIILHQ